MVNLEHIKRYEIGVRQIVNKFQLPIKDLIVNRRHCYGTCNVKIFYLYVGGIFRRSTQIILLLRYHGNSIPGMIEKNNVVRCYVSGLSRQRSTHLSKHKTN